MKWEKEKGAARSSAWVSKKPDRWDHNVMVTKIEEASNVEESLRGKRCWDNSQMNASSKKF